METLYAKAHHPLLLHRHHENLHHARKEVGNATAEIRRRNMHGKNMAAEDETKLHLESMILRVSQLERIINSCLYVLASEPVKIPWFDAIFADIGDEQSLSQSLSTFSGHLKQIGAIRSLSTSKSLVLLDEVGAGTNPLEGAALGMSLLESFAKSGSFLTIVTTHHGELKTLKYRNSVFENACVEFDEESLRPTFKILWGIPGRSNAINIAERLGLPHTVIDGARKLHGIASAEINGVILDMERFKQDFQQHLQQAQHFLMLSKKLHENLFVAKQRISDHVVLQRSRKTKAILDNAAIARSLLRSKMQQFRERAIAEKPSGSGRAESVEKSIENLNQQPPTSDPTERIRQIGKQTKVPEVGDVVYVSSLGKQASVLKVEASKGLVLLQAGNMKLKLKFGDIVTQHLRTSKQ
ncbi:Endonuclease MutS2 [Ananas comosus]|uniref:Endonuclease MutS2 n=1 Tax=Ananas comosus TaxID=4615 RepID=A0A199V562_ANACO|nr:Endonuclease MutS2 [Ananas comosus]